MSDGPHDTSFEILSSLFFVFGLAVFVPADHGQMLIPYFIGSVALAALLQPLIAKIKRFS
jgi:hypothetical protein